MKEQLDVKLLVHKNSQDSKPEDEYIGKVGLCSAALVITILVFLFVLFGMITQVIF